MMKKGGAKTDNYESEKTFDVAQCNVIKVVGHVPRLAPSNRQSAPRKMMQGVGCAA